MDDMEKVGLALNFGLPLLILIGAYLIGNYIEKRHFRNIIEREDALKGFPVTTFAAMPSKWQARRECSSRQTPDLGLRVSFVGGQRP